MAVDDAVRDALLTLTRRVEHEVGCATETHLSAACTCGLSNAINVVTAAALATPQQEQVEDDGWPHETPPGRCIHWPRTCADVQAQIATYFSPCAFCCQPTRGGSQ